MNEPIKSIETISPKPTDTIVLRFEEITVKEMDFWYEYVKDKFPNNTIVALPNQVFLETYGKEVWEDYIKTIYEEVKAMP